MRILFLTQFFDPEPAFIPGTPLATWMARRGHSVEVLTGFPNYPGGRIYPGYSVGLFRREHVEGIPVSRVALYPSHDTSAIRRVANYASFALSASTIGSMVTRAADVVYVYHPPATIGVPAVLWKRLRGLPFVYHVQDLWPESVMQAGMLPDRMTRHVERSIAWACRKVYERAGRVVVLSDEFKRALVARGVPRDKVVVIHNWTDESIFHVQPPDPSLAAELGLTGTFNVLYAGNLGRFQGLDVAIRAAARVKHLPNFRLVFIGGGGVEPELRALATATGAGNVRFLDRRPYVQMGAVNAVADALLISLANFESLRGTVPGKVQVSLASGRPVVASLQGEAASMIERSGAGIVCRPGDDHALAAAFERLYRARPNDLARMGAAGRAFYDRELALDKGAPRLEDVLHDVAVGRSAYG